MDKEVVDMVIFFENLALPEGIELFEDWGGCTVFPVPAKKDSVQPLTESHRVFALIRKMQDGTRRFHTIEYQSLTDSDLQQKIDSAIEKLLKDGE